MIAQTKDTKFEKIWTFLSEQSLLSFATSVDNVPYCATCFYVFDEEHKCLAFKSKRKTKHIQDALQQPAVAGTILPNIQDFGKMRGLQFQGMFSSSESKVGILARKKFYKKYPYARVMAGEVWLINLSYIKMTDNRLGIGKRLEWPSPTI